MTVSPPVAAEARTAGPAAHVLHDVAAGAATRGTVLVLPGRGENAAVYLRLATRLASDGYRVAVADDAGAGAAVLDRLVAGLRGDAPAGAPLVVLGSDTGALRALALAGADGLVLAGLPVPGAAPSAAAGQGPSWDDELDARTACPVHRSRLGENRGLVRGAVFDGPVDDWTASPPAVPTLVVHGEDDVISPLPRLRDHAAGALGRIVVVNGGRHDVLNDVHHRSVAAAIVQFLEALRLDPSARPVLQEVA